MKRIKYQADIDSQTLETLQAGMLGWYRQYGRELPWRQTRDPYAVIVSEIMLHQTTVNTVVPVYLRFMEKFPTVFDLASAPLEEVKHITDPLGYKVRGQWLKNIAEVIVTEHEGEWPKTLEGWMALPGVGRYTAGAVLSFAFEQDAAILDTNVRRVLGRYFGIAYRETRAEVVHRLWALAEAIVPKGEAFHFNQALMDFGAMVCTARHPACTICPVVDQCVTVGEGVPEAAAEEVSAYTIRTRADP
ncbi:MAG: adenine glycosylase [Sulfobacillus acidophilus]|uniref:Adenine DNA glycosylase n=1 Tax=Sulfobacillus acidophilus TaxID=53633 RepID=A0A2T2WPE9_9FIRM|nr:MAG: adenine glycosylase [Sulfobacillus acidophilus]